MKTAFEIGNRLVTAKGIMKFLINLVNLFLFVTK